ncbi:hypothetical protein GE278_20345 [Enterobacteriaceae bacterium Kacie_13]|nr:hypothetical protein GE278_20345 [Enterobacteriaceae bacterium Kacie_13]
MHAKIHTICHRIAVSHAVFDFFVCSAAVLLISVEPELWMTAIPVAVSMAVYFLIRSVGWIISRHMGHGLR